MNSTLHIEGYLRIREIPPEWSENDFKHWWARMTEKEKDRWTVWEGKNLITNQGRNQILEFIYFSAGGVNAFSQQFSVGTGTIYTVQPSDTTIAGELARVAPSATSLVGNTTTISSTFSTSQGNGTWTNAGMWGNVATSTLGTGNLFTHLLCSFTKTSASAITCDYSVTLT